MNYTKYLFITLFIFPCLYAFSQGVAVNNSGLPADSSAILDVSSSNTGILIPRVALNDTADDVTITLPRNSLIIYNTTVNSQLSEGFYYNSGTSVSPYWRKLLPTPSDLTLNMSNYKIVNLATCTNDHDAANKAYVDAAIVAGGGGGGGGGFPPLPTMVTDESGATMTFAAACAYCNALSDSGYTDWRIPTFYEIVYIMNTVSVPNSTSGNYFWLADREMGNSSYEYMVMRISDGAMSYNYAYNPYRVRCVR